MNSGNSQNTGSSGVTGFLMGRGLPSQIVLGIVIGASLYILLLAFEILYTSFIRVRGTRIDILPLTCSSERKPREFEQNPADPKNLLLPFSDNERSGVEFTYSFFIYVNPSTFRTEEGLLHVFHKGYPNPYPMLAPGVFLKSNTNTLRVYMNSTKHWNNFVDVEEIPVRKWVHVAIVCKSNALDIYINGNISKRLPLSDAAPYQNFQNLYLFSQRTCAISAVEAPSLGQTRFDVLGTYNGLLSRFTYFSYAISYTELQGLCDLGPNPRTEDDGQDSPPYLMDNWWVSKYSPNN